MAVYTELSDADLTAFLAQYELGPVQSCKGIAEGVENSNFLLVTGTGTYILTLFEKRVAEADLPFFVGLMRHLVAKGLPCAQPIPGRDGEALRSVAGRPALVASFLPGLWPRTQTPAHCETVGAALARLHRAARDFPLTRENALTLPAWRRLVERLAPRADAVSDGLGGEIAVEVGAVAAAWPWALPRGIIHADLFPDNTLWQGERLTGLIDFYFACSDALAYDLAVCMNAWCFSPDGSSFDPARGAALLRGYQSVRPLEPLERQALPVLCRGAALRFLLTRLQDWLDTPETALVCRKDPMEYWRRLIFHRRVADAAAYGLVPA